MSVWVPGDKIASDAATAELRYDLSKRHIHINRHEVPTVHAVITCHSVPVRVPNVSPSEPHGLAVSMKSSNAHFCTNVANVLFERNLHYHCPRLRNFLLVFFFFVGVVLMELVEE